MCQVCTGFAEALRYRPLLLLGPCCSSRGYLWLTALPHLFTGTFSVSGIWASEQSLTSSMVVTVESLSASSKPPGQEATSTVPPRAAAVDCTERQTSCNNRPATLQVLVFVPIITKTLFWCRHHLVSFKTKPRQKVLEMY